MIVASQVDEAEAHQPDEKIGQLVRSLDRVDGEVKPHEGVHREADIVEMAIIVSGVIRPRGNPAPGLTLSPGAPGFFRRIDEGLAGDDGPSIEARLGGIDTA